MNRTGKISVFFVGILLIIASLLIVINSQKVLAPAEVGTSLVLFFDGDIIPTGWTCISCNSTDVAYQRFIRGSDSYGTLGGATSHNHTSNLIQVSTVSCTKLNTVSDSVPSSHTHNVASYSISNATNIPSYRNLKIIKYDNGIPTTIPAGIIAMFNGTIPSGWTTYAVENNYFIRGENLTNQTGGSNTHSHLINATLSTVSGSADRGGESSPQDAATHTHNFTNKPTNISSNIPSFVSVVMAKSNSEVILPKGMIALFNSTPDTTSWSILSNASGAMYNKILLANSTYNQTGGSNTNNHANATNTTGTASNSKNGNSASGGSACLASHTHPVTVANISNSTSTPPYITFIIAQLTSTLNVELVSPTDNQHLTSQEVIFVCNTSSSSANITNISLYGNWSGGWHLNYTNDTSALNINSTMLNLTINLTTDGTFKYSCKSFDNIGNNIMFSNYTFLINSGEPILIVTSPSVPNQYISTSVMNIYGTAESAFQDTIVINDTDFGVNVGDYDTWNFTNSSIYEGNYSVRITANDTDGNSVYEDVGFIIDITFPSMNLSSQTETDNSHLNRNYIQSNSTTTDLNILGLTTILTNSLSSTINYSEEYYPSVGFNLFQNSTILSDDVYYLSNVAIDMASNTNISTRTIYIDTQNPGMLWVTPDDTTNINASTLFNCSVYDNGDSGGLKNVTFYTNLSGSWQVQESKNVTGGLNESNFTVFMLDTPSFTNGAYLWGCKVYDLAGNSGNSLNRTFIINKSVEIKSLRGNNSQVTGNELKNFKFYNNLTLRAYLSTNETITYSNFSLKDPNGIVRYYYTNGTSENNENWTSLNSTILNVSGKWYANVTILNSGNQIANYGEYFNITDVVGHLSSYQHSTTTTEKGGNISYNLTLWHDTNECFNYSFTPLLSYGNNFTIYKQYNNLTVCGGDIYHPYYNLITIYVNTSSTDGVYLGNITINRTNTSTLYVSTINLTVNPPTASPYLYDSNNIYACQNTMNGNCSWEAGNQVGVFKAMYYYVQNLGDYNATKCNLNIITNETMWDYAIDLKDFSLTVNESKKIKLDIRVTSGYGETKQAYVGITCDNSTPWGYPASTPPSNNPIIYWIIDELPQSNTGGGGGGGGGAQTTPAYICDNKNMSWKAENERGGGSYSFLMLNDNVNGIRGGKVYLSNLFKTSTIDININCFDGGYVRDGIKINNSNICNYIAIDKTKIKLLPTAEKQEINFYVNISQAQEYKIGDKIYASLLLKDVGGCEYYFPITVEMSSKASALSLLGLINKLNECKLLFNTCIQYWAILLISLIITSTLWMILFISMKTEYYLAYGILAGLLSSIVIFIFI